MGPGPVREMSRSASALPTLAFMLSISTAAWSSSVGRLPPPSRSQSACTYAMPCRPIVSRSATRNPHRPQTPNPSAQLQDLLTSDTDTPRSLMPPIPPRATNNPKATPHDPLTGKTARRVVPLLTTTWYHSHGGTSPELPGKQNRTVSLGGITDMFDSAMLAFPRAGDARPTPSKPVLPPWTRGQNAVDERTS